MFNAYYPDSTEIAVLEKTLRNTLASFQPDLCEFKLDLAPVASVLVHLEVIRSSGRMTVKDLAEALMEAPEDCKRYTTINLEVDDDIFELQKKGETLCSQDAGFIY